MGINYQRIISVKRGRTERFQRLMLAYSEFVRTHSPHCEVYTEPTRKGGREFIVMERCPDQTAAVRLRIGSCFDDLWLPAIMSLVNSVEVRMWDDAEVHERL